VAVAIAALLVGALVVVGGWRMISAHRPTSGSPPVLVAAPGPPPSSAPAGPRTLTVIGAGDVLVHPEVWQQAAADAKAAGRTGYDFLPMFQGVSPTIRGADLAICHMEVVIGPGAPSGFPYFKAPPQIADAVRGAGFDACSTVSNHTLDHGVTGVSTTLDALEAAGLRHTGSYARVTFTEVGPGRWRISTVEAISTWVDISPEIRLVDLPRALGDPATPAHLRATYQAAYNRIKSYLLSRGAGPAGLRVVAPAAG
jgi:hypothetical protein